MERTLICITSCNRLDEVKKYILPYVDFTNRNEGFHFLLALDGNNKEYIEFCNEFEIPLLYSEEREGVGMSKNRVLTQFPDFYHYFFIDDDVELVDEKIFQLHIDIAKKANPVYHHLSSTRFFELSDTSKVDGHLMNHNYRGGGYFNYFSKLGLSKVGGWHTEFAKHKRYGHTEHTYRFVNAEMAKYPFSVIDECIEMVMIHSPEHVTAPDQSMIDEKDELFIAEKELINQKLSFFELQTIAKFEFNGFGTEKSKAVESYLSHHHEKYPLLTGKERKLSISKFYFNNFRMESSFLKQLKYFMLSVYYSRSNNDLKHWMKSKLKRK